MVPKWKRISLSFVASMLPTTRDYPYVATPRELTTTAHFHRGLFFSEFVSLVLVVYRNCYRHAFVGHIIGNSYLSGSGTLSDL